MSQQKEGSLSDRLRKLADEVRRVGAEQKLQQTEKKAAHATALLGLELLARRITR